MAVEVRKVMTRILKEYPGLPGRRPGDRIYLAEWNDYFPARHQVDESFFSLRASLAPDGAGLPWREVDLLSPFDLPFEPADPAAMTAVLRGAACLGASPSWLRKDPWPLWTVPLVAAGMDRPLVTPVKFRGGRSDDPVSAHGGVAGPPKPPAALTPGPVSSRSAAAQPQSGAWAA